MRPATDSTIPAIAAARARAPVVRVPESLRDGLRRQAKAAHRRKALGPLGTPFGQVAVDGKHTAIDAWDELYAQKQEHSSAVGVSGVVRTMTCSLVSSRAKICLDASPIPSATNEMGHFAKVLEALAAAYGKLNFFRLISARADAGMASEANGGLVVGQYHWDYLFRLNAEQPTLFREAKRFLGRRTLLPLEPRAGSALARPVARRGPTALGRGERLS